MLTLASASLALTVATHAEAPRSLSSPAVRGVVDALTRHRIVAIAESHGLRAAGDFYIALVRDSAFQSLAPDIVIEFASRQSQDLLDRYVLRGDSIAADSVRSIWRNTTKVASWESPVYAEWLAAIRDVNLHLTAARRIRVLAADTRVDWPAMHARSDWAQLGDNNISFAEIISRDVLSRGRRALVVMGSNHLMRTGTRDDAPNTTTLVEHSFPGAMYVIWLYTGRPGGPDTDARMRSERWTAPTLVALRGSWVGALPAGSHRFDKIADALLFLGPSDSLSTVDVASTELDLTYRRELDRRSWIEWGDSARARTFLRLPAPPPAGHVAEFRVPSKAYGRQRHVWVYTPPGYSANSCHECSLIVAFDGGVYTADIPLPEMLDSLIAAKRIPPTLALMIDDGSSSERLADLANRAPFLSFVSEELMPWLHGRWSVTNNPARTIITGSSAGGLAAAYLAFHRPDMFGNVLSQSGAFWRGNEGSNDAPYEWVTARYAESPRRSVRFFVDVGSEESGGAMGGRAPSILAANRRLRDVLQSKGYRVAYYEVPNGIHAPSAWRLRLPVGIVALAQP